MSYYVRIPVFGGQIRRLEDPIEEGRFCYYALVRSRDLPADLPLDVNPRKQNLLSPISKKIRAGFKETPDQFHLLNRGITIIAQDATYNNHNGILSIEFPERDLEYVQDDESDNGERLPDRYDMATYVGDKSYGIVDGGHTYKIILEEVKASRAGAQKEAAPIDPYVRLEVLVGVEDMAIDLARARNIAAQVTEQSIGELGGKFKWLKEEVFRGKWYADCIAYKENEDKREKPVDIREVIQILAAFHPEYLSREKAPIISYTSAGRCLKLFVSEEDLYERDRELNGFRQLRPIANDILELYDHIRATFADHYKRLGGYKRIREGKDMNGDISPNTGHATGHPGATHEFVDHGRSKELYFVRESNRYWPVQGFVMPLLSAFGALVRIDPTTHLAEWRVEPKDLYDKNGQEYARTILEAAEQLGRKPNAVGKSRNLWKALYQNVLVDYLQEQGALKDYVK